MTSGAKLLSFYEVPCPKCDKEARLEAWDCSAGIVWRVHCWHCYFIGNNSSSAKSALWFACKLPEDCIMIYGQEEI
jgi:hypothetical protein